MFDFGEVLRRPRRLERSDLGGAETYADVYFERQPSGIWHVGRSPRPKKGMPEDDEQAALFSWLRSPEQAAKFRSHSIPNDGAGSKERMVSLKRTGLTKGVCDLYVMGAAGNLAIEMKKEDGRVSDASPEQIAWLEGLAVLPSWTSCLVFGNYAARAAVRRFLGDGVQS